MLATVWPWLSSTPLHGRRTSENTCFRLSNVSLAKPKHLDHHRIWLLILPFHAERDLRLLGLDCTFTSRYWKISKLAMHSRYVPLLGPRTVLVVPRAIPFALFEIAGVAVPVSTSHSPG